MPDLRIDVQRRHASEATVVLEVIISGRHLGSLARPAIDRPAYSVSALWDTYTFDRKKNRLAGEKIY